MNVTASYEEYFVTNVAEAPRRTEFRLDRAKQGCDKILFLFNEGAPLKAILQHRFQLGKPFDFEIKERLPEGFCHISKVFVPFGEAADESDRAPVYWVAEVMTEADKSVFVLNQAKDGCDQIEFPFNGGAEMKTLLLGFFQGGKAFDFRIKKKLGNGRCSIDKVLVPYQ